MNSSSPRGSKQLTAYCLTCYTTKLQSYISVFEERVESYNGISKFGVQQLEGIDGRRWRPFREEAMHLLNAEVIRIGCRLQELGQC